MNLIFIQIIFKYNKKVEPFVKHGNKEKKRNVNESEVGLNQKHSNMLICILFV
jgi:hypothetical protein